MGLFLAVGGRRKSFSESVKHTTSIGELKQTAGTQSSLSKMFSSFEKKKSSLCSQKVYLWKDLEKKRRRTETPQVWDENYSRCDLFSMLGNDVYYLSVAFTV